MKVAWGAKLWRDGAKMPTKATPGSSGYDVYAWLDGIYPVGRQGIRYMRLECGERCVIKTGVNLRIPEGYEVQVRPRSGLSLKTSLLVVNAPGTIDSDYRGEVKIILGNFGTKDELISHGDRVAQLVLAPVTQALYIVAEEMLSETVRGAGGFGSTGKI